MNTGQSSSDTYPQNEEMRGFEAVTPKNSGLSEQTLAMIQKALCAYPSVEIALVFGSRAKGNFREGSDVDIAVRGVSTLTAIDISAELNERLPLPYFFDVVALEELDSEPLREHIFRVGKLLFQRENTKKEESTVSK